MKTAELEDLKRDATQLEAFVLGQEVVRLMVNGNAVAMLTPINRTEPPKAFNWPDFAAQRRAVFGDRVLPPGTVQSLIDEDRDER
jgi:hypothetical protein